ncbi:MAG TPA: hypothetical protein VGU61_09235 [Noviherbaspirillum sp.]|jgi:hypothetical protein|uniref:hypothetical protein n=1 Tax=Noviherbaspirillum sp. TaxID=1926288 RepID=UPI002DDD3904|nr:hypothetical protein [Noviherbaspirillum sp.]HEV2610437.1 hypothetical protein [Noviherbaspirillum sp.]
MYRDLIPDTIRRFILTSINSVPYLEAMLLLRSAPAQWWDGKKVAQRLYMPEKAAEAVLEELNAAGVLAVVDDEFRSYRYQPATEELRQIIDELADTYARHLVEVTHLIHSKTSKKAQQFADAFKLRKDS